MTTSKLRDYPLIKKQFEKLDPELLTIPFDKEKIEKFKKDFELEFKFYYCEDLRTRKIENIEAMSLEDRRLLEYKAGIKYFFIFDESSFPKNGLNRPIITDFFNEYLPPDLLYIHPYFDLDFKDTENFEDIKKGVHDLIKLFNSWIPLIGNYSIGGYIGNDFARDIVPLAINKDGKIVSFHIIFYESIIKRSDLLKLMKELKIDFLDSAPYNNKWQKFRHIYSDKKTGSEIKHRKGKYYRPNTYEEITPPFYQTIIQPLGNEFLINDEDIKELKDEIIKIFPEGLTTEKNKTNKRTEPIEEINKNPDLIILKEPEIIELLESFTKEPEPEDVAHLCGILSHSPISKDVLIFACSSWYNYRERQHPDNPEKYINTYYEQEENNKYFYSLISLLGGVNFEKAEQLRNKYNKTHNFNDSTLSFNEVSNKMILNKYYNIKEKAIKKIISELRMCLACYFGVWYLRIRDEDGFTKIEEIDREELKKRTENIKFNFYEYDKKKKETEEFDDLIDTAEEQQKKKTGKMSMWELITRHTLNEFNYTKKTLSKGLIDSQTIRLFEGYKYPRIHEEHPENNQIIKPFIDHIKKIICRNDDDYFNYFIDWFAFIIQKITVKTNVCLIITGEGGCGKSLIVDTIAELLGNHSVIAANLSALFGNFNGILDYKKVLYVIDESPNTSKENEEREERMKSVITSKKAMITKKGKDTKEETIFSNFIITTNSINPVKMDLMARRYVMIRPEDNIPTKAYFKKMMKDIQPIEQGPYEPQAMGLLLDYFLNRNIEEFNPSNIENLLKKEQKAKAEASLKSLNFLMIFIIDNLDKFLNNEDEPQPFTFENLKLLLNQDLKQMTEFDFYSSNKKFLNMTKSGKYHNKTMYRLKTKEESPELWELIKTRYERQEEKTEEKKEEKKEDTMEDLIIKEEEEEEIKEEIEEGPKFEDEKWLDEYLEQENPIEPPTEPPTNSYIPINQLIEEVKSRKDNEKLKVDIEKLNLNPSNYSKIKKIINGVKAIKNHNISQDKTLKLINQQAIEVNDLNELFGKLKNDPKNNVLKFADWLCVFYLILEDTRKRDKTIYKLAHKGATVQDLDLLISEHNEKMKKLKNKI